MCGRYQFSSRESREMQQIVRDAERRSRGQFNELNFPMAGDIAPTQVAPVLIASGDKVVAEFQRWGIPGWRGGLMINARAETVCEKPMFRRSMVDSAVSFLPAGTMSGMPASTSISSRCRAGPSTRRASTTMWTALTVTLS